MPAAAAEGVIMPGGAGAGGPGAAAGGAGGNGDPLPPSAAPPDLRFFLRASSLALDVWLSPDSCVTPPGGGGGGMRWRLSSLFT